MIIQWNIYDMIIYGNWLVSFFFLNIYGNVMHLGRFLKFMYLISPFSQCMDFSEMLGTQWKKYAQLKTGPHWLFQP